MEKNDPAWPDFLNYLDRDPDKAFKGFYRFASAALRITPPKLIMSLDSEDREELSGEIIYHCAKEEFRALRQYVNKGKPFAGWFYVLAHNKARDFLRKKGREFKMLSNNPDRHNDDIVEALPNPGPNGETTANLSELLSITREALMKLSAYCQLLLKMAADEFTPREMVKALRLAKGQNKKVSDDLRECRRKLIQILANEGIDIKSYIKT